MESIIVNSNKEYAIKLFKDTLEKFTKAIIEKNNTIEELKKEILSIEKDRARFANAYAKSIRVIMTRKQYLKYLEKNKFEGGNYMSLSDKIQKLDYYDEKVIEAEDVKKFIKELKEDIKTSGMIDELQRERFIWEINKLAGKDLI